METQEGKATSMMSKKRYQEILNRASTYCTQEQVDTIAQVIRDVMNFDPTKSTYTKEKGIKTVENRKKKSIATGISQYILCGNDKIYAKKKMAKETAST
jgi:hypothetical protein